MKRFPRPLPSAVPPAGQRPACRHGGQAAAAADEEAQPDRPGEQAENAQDPGGRRRGRRRRGPSLQGELCWAGRCSPSRLGVLRAAVPQPGDHCCGRMATKPVKCHLLARGRPLDKTQLIFFQPLPSAASLPTPELPALLGSCKGCCDKINAALWQRRAVQRGGGTKAA